MQSNRIRKIENLDALESLEELYLSHNGVERFENLEHNVRDLCRFSSDGKLKYHCICICQIMLTTLDVGNNSIPEIENLSHLKHLTELWVRKYSPRKRGYLLITSGQVNHNKIETLRALERELASLPLQTIYLEGNPCQQAEGANYRRKIMLALPSTLTQIDATWVYHSFISAKPTD